MRVFFLLLLLGGAVVGGTMVARERGISLSSIRLPGNVAVPQIAIDPTSSSGEILGTQTPLTISHFADRFAGIGQTLAKILGPLGVQTVKTGETIVKNVTSTPTSSAEIIDMSEVVRDVSNKVESIPGDLMNQAKIEYCRQVLEKATASAKVQ